MKAAVMDVVGTHFRPEFINRIDESVVFHPLGREQIRAHRRDPDRAICASAWRTGTWGWS